MRAQPQIIGATIGRDDQRGFQAHFTWFDDHMLGFFDSAPGQRGLDRPPDIVTDIDRVHLFARLQGDIADMQRRTDDADLVHAVRERDESIGPRDRRTA